MFQDIFERSINENKILSINTYGDSSTWVGYVNSYTTEIVSIKHISKFGRYDGVISLKVSDIERIDIDDDLCRSISFLHQNEKEIKRLSKMYEEQEVDKTDYRSVLQECCDKKLLCSIDTKDLYLGCFVLEITFEEVRILVIDSHGIKDGESCVRLEDINFVSYGRLQDIRRLLLYSNNYG